MSHSNGKITAPVDLVSDIAYVLGKSTGDLGELCKSEEVNMWSQIKPLRINSPSIEISKDRIWQSAPDYKAGIKIMPLGRGSDLAHLYNFHDPSCFQYDRPQDGDWFRALDFDGYYHYALNPFGVELYCPSKVLVGQSFSMYVTERVVNSDSIQLEDMEIAGLSLGEMHFGCFFDGSMTVLHTTSAKLVTQSQEGYRMLNEEMDVSTTQTTGGLTAGLYTAYPMISVDVFSGYDPTRVTGSIMDIPGLRPVTFEVVTNGYVNEGLSLGERIDSGLAARFRFAFTVLRQSNMNFEGRYALFNPLGVQMSPWENYTIVASAGTTTGARTTYSEYLETIRMSAPIDQNWYIGYEFNFQNGAYQYIGRIRIV